MIRGEVMPQVGRESPVIGAVGDQNKLFLGYGLSLELWRR